MQNTKRTLAPALSAALALLAPVVPADEWNPPISGKPVPALQLFDQVVVDRMQATNLEAAVLGVMKDGAIVYLRGFGYLDPGGFDFFSFEFTPPTSLSENAMMRLASVEKPLTAAAIHKLVAADVLELDDYAFDLGQPGGGILSIDPFGGLGAEDLKDITIQHLLDHKGGWDHGAVGGWKPFTNNGVVNGVDQNYITQMAQMMGVPSPPNREQVAAFMLGQPLQYIPGATYDYSNFGYMVLGLIVEDLSGMSHQDYLRQAVFGPDMWVPSTELHLGRSFKQDQSPREPWYRTSKNGQPVNMVPNVFDPDGPAVNKPYGGWSQECFAGSGNLVASAATILYFMDEYFIGGNKAGKPLAGSSANTWKGGSLAGTSVIAQQLPDEINLIVLCNEGPNGSAIRDGIIAAINDNDLAWPTASVDGFWVDFDQPDSGFGGYHDPLAGIEGALAGTSDGSKWRLKPGSTEWTGTLDQRLLIDAPLGPVVIGD